MTKEFSRTYGPRRVYGGITVGFDPSSKTHVEFEVDISGFEESQFLRKSIVEAILEACRAEPGYEPRAGKFTVHDVIASGEKSANVTTAYKTAAFEAATQLLREAEADQLRNEE
ncbi:MAG: hypothetical protein AAGI24_16730 [Pseudomonadota bacterium]